MEALIYDKDAGDFSMNNQLMFDRYDAETYEEDRAVHVAQDEVEKQQRYVRCAKAAQKLYKVIGLPLYGHMSDEALHGALTLVYGNGFVHPEQVQVLRRLLPYNPNPLEHN